MGHKVHPVGFRVGIIRGWDAKWYADKHYVTYLQEDLKVRKAIRSMYPEAGVSQVEIDRQANNLTLTIHTARPGILIGRGGQRVEEMRNSLEKLIGKKIQLNIREVQQPELDAFLVARSVADQMERRVAYRRAMKQSLLRTIQAGAKGMRIRCAGRLDGAEIARKVIMHEGRVPLHTIRADIDYGLTLPEKGKLPVNPSGGLLACGHPIGATGIMQAVFSLWQLQHRIADKFGSEILQVKNATRGGFHSHAGTGTYITLTLAEKAW